MRPPLMHAHYMESCNTNISTACFKVTLFKKVFTTKAMNSNSTLSLHFSITSREDFITKENFRTLDEILSSDVSLSDDYELAFFHAP